MVDCSQVQAALVENRGLPGAPLAAHTARCPGCRELLAHGAALGRLLARARRAAPRVAEGRLAVAVADDLSRDDGPLGRLRAIPTSQRIALAGLVAIVPVLLFAVDNPRALAPGRWVTVAFGGLLVMAIGALLAPMNQVRRAPRQLVVAAVALAIPVLRVLLIGTTTGPVTHAADSCLLIGMASAAPAIALLHVMARRARLTAVEVLLAGSIGGLGANMALQLHCIDKRLEHLLAGHVSIALVWIVGSWLAQRWRPAAA